ncbi:hypothetical protein N7491_005936 [Penicillium cf. griseofulvum]|uniref:Uncharacterized protein n=1 Tax=Penicillium cf. griseofulvum TaxID=2972120 RepID=A0A9W9J4H7_9EURO|nr:hypothetical protein N7472_008618 [Penicillium cf. griseofulvum]KAJ5435341.1 hypothetical protein N7491_005936 [Penicillium cf. griseofulvum]KAJ5453172.1 hypothetical protein N7445_001355 [Penicillium cf. griseofulvum]
MSLFFATQDWAEWCKSRYKVHWAEYEDTVLCVYQIPALGGNFPSEIETRSLSFSTLLVWRSHICITSLTALHLFD